MSSSDPFNPITTYRTLQTPKGHIIFSTTRRVAAEFPLPALGTAIEDTFISGFTGHKVLDVSASPLAGGGKSVTVTHGTFPAGIFTEYESQAYTFPAIYPTPGIQPGGARPRQRVVPARVTYEYQEYIGTWMDDPVTWDELDPSTGPFVVYSYIAEAAGANFVANDGSSGRVGDYLNPAFIQLDTINNQLTIHDPGNVLYIVLASSPDATTYATWFLTGTEIMVSRTIHKWYTGYMKRTAYVRVQ